MTIDEKNRASNEITVDGVTFKTQGNILFSDSEDTPYYLAQNSHLEKMESYLEHGMRMLLKKAKTNDSAVK